MVPVTSGHHRGHRRIALRARPGRWDQRLLGAPLHWHEAAGEGYPPPGEMSRHQTLERPLDQGLAAVEKIPRFVAMGAAADPHGRLRVPHELAEGEREGEGEGDDGGAPVFRRSWG